MVKNVLLFISLAALVVVLSGPYYEVNACPQHDTDRTYTSP